MDENGHPRGALLFMLGYLLLRPATTTPLTTPGFRVW